MQDCEDASLNASNDHRTNAATVCRDAQVSLHQPFLLIRSHVEAAKKVGRSGLGVQRSFTSAGTQG